MSKQAIICVDDEEIILNSLDHELHDEFGDKYLIELANSGEEALELIDELIEDEIDVPLIICDYIMPTMKGDEVLIKAQQKLPFTKNILLTGQASVEGIVNIINNTRLFRYIQKPWEKPDLLLTIKNAIESYEKDVLLCKYYDDFKEIIKSGKFDEFVQRIKKEIKDS
jgi:DNA-binding NtrC family response regulator